MIIFIVLWQITQKSIIDAGPIPELSDKTMRTESNWSKTGRPPIFLCDSGAHFCMNLLQCVAPSWTTFSPLGFSDRHVLVEPAWCGLAAHTEINQSDTVCSRAPEPISFFALISQMSRDRARVRWAKQPKKCFLRTRTRAHARTQRHTKWNHFIASINAATEISWNGIDCPFMNLIFMINFCFSFSSALAHSSFLISCHFQQVPLAGPSQVSSAAFCGSTKRNC